MKTYQKLKRSEPFFSIFSLTSNYEVSSWSFGYFSTGLIYLMRTLSFGIWKFIFFPPIHIIIQFNWLNFVLQTTKISYWNLLTTIPGTKMKHCNWSLQKRYFLTGRRPFDYLQLGLKGTGLGNNLVSNFNLPLVQLLVVFITYTWWVTYSYPLYGRKWTNEMGYSPTYTGQHGEKMTDLVLLPSSHTRPLFNLFYPTSLG